VSNKRPESKDSRQSYSDDVGEGVTEEENKSCESADDRKQTQDAKGHSPGPYTGNFRFAPYSEMGVGHYRMGMWDAVIRALRFLDKMYRIGWSMLVWELRVMVLFIAAVLIWLLVTGRLTG
jgi:hypothetical protein